MKSYSVKEIAELLQTNPETVRRWIRSGKLEATRGPSRKKGNSVSAAALQSFLDDAPKYAAVAAACTSSPAVRLTGAALAAIGGIAAAKKGSDNAIEDAAVDSAEIRAYLGKEANSLKRSIAKKRGTVKQLTEEIERDEQRLEEMKGLLVYLRDQEASHRSGKDAQDVEKEDEESCD